MNILILEDDPTRIAAFVERHKGDNLTICTTAPAAIELLDVVQNDVYDRGYSNRPDDFDIVYLDHDLGENAGNGLMVVHAIIHNMRVQIGKIIVHSHNPVGGLRMLQELQNEGYNVVWEKFSA